MIKPTPYANVLHIVSSVVVTAKVGHLSSIVQLRKRRLRGFKLRSLQL